VEGALIADVDKHGDNPVVIRLTDEERLSGKTKPETIQEILKYFHSDGFVVLENAIDEHLVDRLYNRMVQDNAVYVKKPQMRWNQGVDTGNTSQIPPLTPDWLHRDFYANPHMIRVVENILGPRPSSVSLTAMWRFLEAPDGKRCIAISIMHIPKFPLAWS